MTGPKAIIIGLRGPYPGGQGAGPEREPLGGRPGDTPCERRRDHARCLMQKPLLAVPVLADGSPDWEHRLLGNSLDLSPEGIGLELVTAAELPGSAWVLLLQEADGSLQSAGIEIRYQKRDGAGPLKVGARFGGLGEEILRPANLTPTFRPDTMQLTLGFPESVLSQWAEIGILHLVQVDRVQVCPKCHGLPSFRRGCQSCGSARVSCDQLIHHFPCAYVGFVSAFEGPQGELICPKCRTRRLVVGSDYEYLNGPYRCQDCQWSDTELEQIAQCVRCQFRFPGFQAAELELKGYHAHRLDALAFLAQP
jgi:TackOD1 domain-containing protein